MSSQSEYLGKKKCCLISLKGPTGPEGAQGSQGLQGPIGYTGPNGVSSTTLATVTNETITVNDTDFTLVT